MLPFHCGFQLALRNVIVSAVYFYGFCDRDSPFEAQSSNCLSINGDVRPLCNAEGPWKHFLCLFLMKEQNIDSLTAARCVGDGPAKR